jgi:hypothetical protein
MTPITIDLLENYADMMEDLDYSRYVQGGYVTPEIIRAATILTARELDAFATGDVLRTLTRGWNEYTDLSHLASQDEEWDELNNLMLRFGFSSAQREAADEVVGKKLIQEIREKKTADGSGESVVWYEDADVPGENMISGIFVFNAKAR